MILYHGSKTGISGRIRYDYGRATCDFGRGFYAGEKKEQPVSLVAGFEKATLYTLECSFDGLNVFSFDDTYESRMDWALFVAYNRNILDFSVYPRLKKRFDTWIREYDVICGNIANDRMTIALDYFYRGLLCDRALLDALEYVKLGKQYVFKSERSCADTVLHIVDEHRLTPEEKRLTGIQNKNILRQNRDVIEQLQTRYRRAADALFYDEVLSAKEAAS